MDLRKMFVMDISSQPLYAVKFCDVKKVWIQDPQNFKSAIHVLNARLTLFMRDPHNELSFVSKKLAQQVHQIVTFDHV